MVMDLEEMDLCTHLGIGPVGQWGLWKGLAEYVPGRSGQPG